jgi:hypothetical protein
MRAQCDDGWPIVARRVEIDDKRGIADRERIDVPVIPGRPCWLKRTYLAAFSCFLLDRLVPARHAEPPNDSAVVDSRRYCAVRELASIAQFGYPQGSRTDGWQVD